MSRAVVTCSQSGRPEALRKVVRVMPIWRARWVMTRAKLPSEPARCSATAAATSLAERVTRARIALSALIAPPGGTPSLDGGRDAASALKRIGVESSMRPSRNASNIR